MSISLADLKEEKSMLLFIGGSGCGKSTFAFRFPKPWVCNVDGNTKGPRKVFAKEGRDVSGIKVDFLHMDEAGKEVPLIDQYARFDKVTQAAVKDPEIETIILDSTTSFANVVRAEVLRQKRKPIDTKFEFTEWDLYGYIWKHIITWFRNCGKTVIVIGHIKPEKDAMDQVLRYALAIPGQTGDLMPMLVTDVWQFVQKQEIGKNAAGQPCTIDAYWVQTFQTSTNPNIKAALDVPREFRADEAAMALIRPQL